MIICNTTYNIEEKTQEAWLDWVTEIFVPMVMGTGIFIEHQLAKVLVDEEMGGVTFCLQFTSKSMDSYRNFEEEHSNRFDSEMLNRFPNKIVMFRTLMEKM